MTTLDMLELAGRNLRESKLRNGLTTMGIAVGVASLVAMLSLGVGLQQLATKRLGRSGLFDTIFVTSRQDFRGYDRDEDKKDANYAQARLLDQDARHEIEGLPNVIEVQPEIRLMAEVRYADTTHFAVIAGLPPSARDNEAFDSLQGRFFSSAAAEEAILQNDFAKEINPQPQTLIGKELVMRYAQRQPLPEKPGQKRQPQVQVDDASEDDPFGFSVVRREQKLRIVGIIEGEPYGGLRSISRGRVFIPVQLAETLNMMQFSDVRSVPRAQRTYVTLAVRITGPSKVQAAQNAIKQMGFRTFSILDATRSLRRFFAVLDVFLGIFGSLALAVASLAIINTLVMAVLERRREIGIMKAVGASDGDVKSLFFAEAGVMGALGGALGIVLGWGLGRLINFGTNLYLHRRDLPPETIWTLPSWLVVAALVFAVLVSLLAGLYPAARAARLDPIQSLRYE